MGLFKKIKEGLKKTRDAIVGQIDTMLKSFTKIDEELFEELLELLIMGDVGVTTSEHICDELRKRVKKEGITDPAMIHDLLADVIADMLGDSNELMINTKPSIILVIGVNGVGKTTTIGKIAANLVRSGKKVTLAAADTFRAAAIDQLEIWAERSGADIVKQQEGSDPAAVVFDAISSAKAKGSDVIIADTAGRLHNKSILWTSLLRLTELSTESFLMLIKRFCLYLMQQQVKMRLIRQENFRMPQELQVLFLQSLTVQLRAVSFLRLWTTLKFRLNISASENKLTIYNHSIHQILQKRFLQMITMKNNELPILQEVII